MVLLAASGCKLEMVEWLRAKLATVTIGTISLDMPSLPLRNRGSLWRTVLPNNLQQIVWVPSQGTFVQQNHPARTVTGIACEVG
jgi:hypothetical protein